MFSKIDNPLSVLCRNVLRVMKKDNLKIHYRWKTKQEKLYGQLLFDKSNGFGELSQDYI